MRMPLETSLMTFRHMPPSSQHLKQMGVRQPLLIHQQSSMAARLRFMLLLLRVCPFQPQT